MTYIITTLAFRLNLEFCRRHFDNSLNVIAANPSHPWTTVLPPVHHFAFILSNTSIISGTA